VTAPKGASWAGPISFRTLVVSVPDPVVPVNTGHCARSSNSWKVGRSHAYPQVMPLKAVSQAAHLPSVMSGSTVSPYQPGGLQLVASCGMGQPMHDYDPTAARQQLQWPEVSLPH
jgi:hypothetical protein